MANTFELNKEYFFECAAAPGLVLNRYSDAAVANNQNVNVYTPTDSTDQRWKIAQSSASGNGRYVITLLMNEGFALDYYRGSSNLYNCDIYALGNDKTDAEVTIQEVSSNGIDYLRFQLANYPGKYLTYTGGSINDVRWEADRGSKNTSQLWRPIPAHPIYGVGVEYYFVSQVGYRADADPCLNVYGNEVAQNGQNVTIYKAENVNAQKWIIRQAPGGFARLYSALAGGNSFALDLNRVSNNADIYTVANNEQDTLLEIMPDKTKYGLYRVRAVHHNKFLSAAGYPDGADVYWSTGTGGNNQFWKITSDPRFAEGSGGNPGGSTGGNVTNLPIDPPTDLNSVNLFQRYNAPLSFRRNKTTVTNIPDYQYGGGIEPSATFHVGSGFTASSTNFENVKSTMEPILMTFVRKVYGDDVTLPLNKCTYYLFGERLTEASDAEFHPGIDICGPNGHAIHALYGGEVVAVNTGYGGVMIRVPELNIVTCYVHMNISDVFLKSDTFPAYVSAGTVLGYQSNKGAEPNGSHLHFEVRIGTEKGAAKPIKSEFEVMPSIIPYGYMDGVL